MQVVSRRPWGSSRAGRSSRAHDPFPSDRVGRPIEDKTCLYDFTLQPGDLGHDGPATGPDPNSADATGPFIFTAIQKQLGLKLDAEKGPVQVQIVDHVERPTQN